MPLAQSDFTFISDLVRKQAAIVLEPGKEYLVESRLAPLAKAEVQGTISDLVAKLQADWSGKLASKVVDAMTTNETLFFRDGHPFETLRTIVLPQFLQARAAERRISIWCGASSSGQEPYTIAMLLKEVLASHPGFGVELASDVNEEMLERTRQGCYSQLEVNRGLPIASLMQHFDRAGTQWQAKADLRAMIKTRNINLAAPLPTMGPFDLIFMRNVLIYFDNETKLKILTQARRLLRPDGYLFLGGAETTLNIDPGWDRVSLGPSTAYQAKKGY
jgi:chemotaxis protein methyltransferase CheR